MFLRLERARLCRYRTWFYYVVRGVKKGVLLDTVCWGRLQNSSRVAV